jgi:GTP-binding protein Era
MQENHAALESRDLVLLLVDVTEKFGAADEQVLDLVKRCGAPVFLLLNKVDRLHKEKLLPIIEHYSKLHAFQEVIPISAIKRDGLEKLIDKVASALPASPPLFPEDQLTDQPERFLASEIIREKVLLQTGKEVPYATAVIVERYEDLPKLLRIAAAIFCERDGQKAILIGKGGEKLKQMGTSARMELEKRFGKKVYLELFVKVKSGWRQSAAFVEELDWRRQLENLAERPTEEG